MYIKKYWGNYIGGTDDSLTFVAYLAEKQKKEISLNEIFSDFGLDKLQGDFRKPDVPLVFVDSQGWEKDISFAIDLITDIAALLLECKVNGYVNLLELDEDIEADVPDVCITATPEEHKQIDKVLTDFIAAPLEYDLSEMMPKEDIIEMTIVCKELRKELYGE
ncbi:MAG: hypothetical protein HFJ03_02525 [Lachnospira sp.]|jgi:hypothetical protein|nr:hypothetical protein [Lachnospira sp.]